MVKNHKGFMDKKILYQIIFGILGALIIGILGFLYFLDYGGNSCDMPGKDCSCFCCNMFGLRGYEACGNFGFFAGIILGASVSVLIVHFIWKNYYKSKRY